MKLIQNIKLWSSFRVIPKTVILFVFYFWNMNHVEFLFQIKSFHVLSCSGCHVHNWTCSTATAVLNMQKTVKWAFLSLLWSCAMFRCSVLCACWIREVNHNKPCSKFKPCSYSVYDILNHVLSFSNFKFLTNFKRKHKLW